MTTYKEQCLVKRREYLSALQEATQTHGKTPVYIDKMVSKTDFRRYAYAPKGVRVEAKVPSHRYATTTLIAARLDGCSQHLCFSRAVVIRLLSTRGFRRCYVHCLMITTL